MRPRPWRTAATAVLLAATAAAACTSSTGGADGSPTPTAVVTQTPTSSAMDYTYARSGVSARLRYTPGGGVLTIANKSGEEIPQPGVYLLRAEDGRRVEGTVAGAAPLPNGASRTYRVTFAASFARRDVGLILLLIGRDNYGAFIPPTG